MRDLLSKFKAGIMACAFVGLGAVPAMAKNNSPHFVGPTPGSNDTLHVMVGQNLSFTVSGKDADFAKTNGNKNTNGDTITLTSTSLPGTASMAPALPASMYMTSGNANLSSTFSWTPAVTDTGLHTITYTLTDNGAGNLTATRTVNIHVMDTMNNSGPGGCDLQLSAMVTDILCDSTGAIDLTIDSGTAPYTITWSTGDSTEDLTGLGAGTYTVIVTDSANCTDTASFTVDTLDGTISVSPASLVKNGVVTLYDKHGPQSANISVDLDSNSVYMINWTPSTGLMDSTSPVISVSPDSTTTYFVTITDTINNCSLTDSITINVVNIDCGDGKVKVCHKNGKTICVDSSAVDGLLKAGAQLGDCDTLLPKFSNFGEENRLDIYPNPSSGDFTVKIPEVQDEARLTITDLNGKLILTRPATGGQFIDVHLDNAKGIYLIQVIGGAEVYRSKVFIQQQ